jgi:hypothetical protein
MIWEDIRAGRLVHVLPQWQPRGGIVYAVFPSRRGLLPSVRALLDFLARECAARRQLVSGEHHDQCTHDLAVEWLQVRLAASNGSLRSIICLMPRHHYARI